MKVAIAFVASLFVALLLINLLHISYPISVTTSTTSGEFSVVGERNIDAKPDTAYVDAGITVNNAPTVEQAQSTITTANNKILESMAGLGIAKTEITTSNYSIYPMYDNGPIQQTTGYNGNVTISIKVKDISKVSQAISAATAAGANTIQGVRFTIDDPDKLRTQARDKAIENAKQHASEMSKTLGLRLGRITNIVESGNQNGPFPMFEKAMPMAGGGGGSANIEPGTQTVSSTVTLYYEKR